MSWQTLLIASILFTSLKSIFHRVVMRQEKSDAYTQTIVYGLLIGLFSLFISFFTGGFNFPTTSLLFPNLVLMTFLLIAAPLLTFKAYQKITAGEVTIFMSTQFLWVMLLSYFFLHESLTLIQLAGGLLIMAGITVVSIQKKRLRLSQGSIFVLLAAFLYGVSYVNASYILQHLDAPSFEVLASFLPAIILFLLRPPSLKSLYFYHASWNWLKVGGSALLDTLATLSLYFAYQIGRNAAQITSLSATSLVITVVLGAILLHERERLANKIIGSLIVTIGVILLISL